MPGLLAQAGAFWLLQTFTHQYVHLEVLGALLLGPKDDATIREGFRLLREQLGAVLSYYGAMLLVGALAGWGLRSLVRWQKWDRRYWWLRYDNQWHYLLTGEILETDDLQDSIGLSDAKLIRLVFVDVLTKLEKSNTLYSGILVDYKLAADGELRTLYLRETRRKVINGDLSNEPRANPETSALAVADGQETIMTDDYHEVTGDLMVIPYAQILNVNLTYLVDRAVLPPLPIPPAGTADTTFSVGTVAATAPPTTPPA